MALPRRCPGALLLTPLRAEPPAKLNLALAVTGRRPDGYHTLRSVFVRLALHDELEVTVAQDAHGADHLEVAGEEDAPVAGNLVLRAARQLRDGLEHPVPALRFRLLKRIPAAAGLAGGSADAVAALDLAARAWGLRLHPARRLDEALRLGADAPFFAAGYPAALVGGIGERLEPLAPPRPCAGILLVTPTRRLATAEVFAELDRLPLEASSAAPAVDALVSALRAGLDGPGLTAMAADLREANDLWPAALRTSPELGSQRSALEESLSRPVLLTGSGPTLFAIYPSARQAAEAAAQLAAGPPAPLHGAAITATTTIESGGSP